jgi:hypothetical protein
MECNYCKKGFKNASSLNYHIKNTKYCLKLRDENYDGNFKCKNCLKTFSTKQTKDNHENNCKRNINDIISENILLKQMIKDKEDIIEELKDQLKEKDNRIERLATLAINRPTSITQNNQRIINNLTPITEQHLKDHAEFLTLDHIKNGVDGYVQYALEYPLKDKIICTDFSRKRIKYKDEDGNLVDDPEMIKLSQKLFNAVEDKNTILINEYINELRSKYNILIADPNNDMNEDESEEYETKLDFLTHELLKVKQQRKNINEIAKGDKNDIYYDFIRGICLKTIK